MPSQPDESSSLLTLLLSLPTPSRNLRRANLLINTLLAVAALEFVTYPYFDDATDVVYTRVGAVYPDAAKIVVRYPGLSGFNETNATVQVAWRQVPQSGVTEVDVWKDGPTATLSQELDWVNTVKLTGLWPSTTYECVLSILYTLSTSDSVQTRFATRTGRNCHIPRRPSASTPSRTHTSTPVSTSVSWPRPASRRTSRTPRFRVAGLKALTYSRTTSGPRSPLNSSRLSLRPLVRARAQTQL